MTNLEHLLTDPRHRKFVEKAVEEYISCHGAINKYTRQLKTCTDTNCTDCIFHDDDYRCSEQSIIWLHEESEGVIL